jgi:hypothetical protein
MHRASEAYEDGQLRRFHALAAIFRLKNVICVASASSLGQTAWQVSSDMRPKPIAPGGGSERPFCTCQRARTGEC